MFMVVTSATMPDLDTLQADALKAIIVAQQLQILSNDNEIEHLKLLVAKLRRMQFGRRSEKVTRQIEQLELKLEELEVSRAEVTAPSESEPPAKDASSPAKAPDRRRRPLPDHLPRTVHTHMPAADNCPDCGGALKKLGKDISEVLEYIPASFVVIRHVRPRMCCGRCDMIVQAPAPSRPVERGLAGPGLLAHVLTAKVCDHLPLFRQSDIYAREGVDLERSTLAKWVGDSSKLLAPLIETLRRYVMAAEKIHADDTPVPVLAPGNGKTKTGRLWTYVRDDRPAGSLDAPAAWFAYSPDRRGEHPQQHLAKFQGILQADAFAGFDKLYKDGTIQEAPCMAHIRRKFYDLVEAHQSPIAIEAVERIAALYAIEKRFADGLRKCGKKCVAKKHDHCWMRCTTGSKSLWQNSRPSRSMWERFTMRSTSGAQWCVTAMMAASRSITTPQKEPCAPLLLADGIIFLPAPTQVEIALPQSIHSSHRPS
jgi:transposase